MRNAPRVRAWYVGFVVGQNLGTLLLPDRDHGGTLVVGPPWGPRRWDGAPVGTGGAVGAVGTLGTDVQTVPW